MFEERYYKINGVKLPSVTTILKIRNNPALNRWATNLGTEASEQYSQETADIGREIHRYIARLVQGVRINQLEWETLSEEIKNGIRAFQRFSMQAGFTFNEPEKLVYNLKLGYAGTLDCIGKADDYYVLIDWKTGERFWSSYYAQITAYYKALGNKKVKDLYVVNLSRNTGVPVIHMLPGKDCKPYWNYFKSCLSLFKDTKVIELLEGGR